MNPFKSIRDYEKFVYTIGHIFPSVQSSTLVVIPRGKRTAVIHGQLQFINGYRLTIQERLSFDSDAVVIESYGYEMWHNADKIAWYDSQPHPNDPKLAVSHPHHKHIPPNMRSNRIPAPQLNFTQPNLPVLIGEIENMIGAKQSAV